MILTIAILLIVLCATLLGGVWIGWCIRDAAAKQLKPIHDNQLNNLREDLRECHAEEYRLRKEQERYAAANAELAKELMTMHQGEAKAAAAMADTHEVITHAYHLLAEVRAFLPAHGTWAEGGLDCFDKVQASLAKELDIDGMSIPPSTP